MKRFFVSLMMMICLLAWSDLRGQNDPVLMRVGDNLVTQSEFVRAFSKNNNLSTATEKELRDYLDLYVNFKLKVMEGKALKVDTSAQFTSELAVYRNQSSQPYLIDKDVNEKLIEEAYERSKYLVRASHILIDCKANSSEKDTLLAYRKAMDVRNKVLNGMPFAEAAVLYSDDPSARDTENPRTHQVRLGNKGDLGYFTVMDLIYKFENAVYNLKVGEISMPVRTQFGYHLIYLTDKVPAIQKISVSQIFIADSLAPKNQMTAETRAKVDAIMAQKNEVAFEELVSRYSDDKASVEKGGQMEPFAPSYRPGNYVDACLQCKPGEITQPVSSSMGWHIMRLDEIVYKPITEDSKYMLKMKLLQDERSSISKESLIEKLKKEYNYEEKGKKKVFAFIAKHVTRENFDSVKYILADLPGAEKLKPICTFADMKITLRDFAPFLARHRELTFEHGVISFLNDRFPVFLQAAMLEYEDKHLESKYPDFKYLMDEFYDGMVLYEINSQKVWLKAIEDTTGLANYYETHKNQYMGSSASGVVEPKPLSEVRSAVITDYQNYLDAQWVNELKQKYPVKINEEVFKAILSKR